MTTDLTDPVEHARHASRAAATARQEARALRRSRVVEMTRSGMSASAIAEVLGCTTRTVMRDRQDAGLTRAHTPLSDDQLAMVRRLLIEEGAGYAETARTVGCNPATLRKRFPGYGMSKGWDFVHFMRGIGKYRDNPDVFGVDNP